MSLLSALLAWPLREFWPAFAAALAVALLGGTALPRRRPRAWRATIGLAAVAAVAVEIPILRAHMRHYELLGREVVGWLAFSAGVVALAAVAAWFGDQEGWPAAGRVGASVVVVALLVPLCPLFLIVVHCTTGDCL